MRNPHIAILLGLLAVLATHPPTTLASGDAPVVADADKIEIEIWAIRATTKSKDISPELKPLAEVLKKQFKYTGFKLEKRDREEVELDKPARSDLTGPYRTQITPKAKAAGKIKLEIEVVKKVRGKDKVILKTTVNVAAGGLVPVGCGSLDGGDYAILAVRAR